MNLFDKIERVRIDKQLGITDFLKKTHFPKTTYYNLMNGQQVSITPKSISKITNVYPEYKYEWFFEAEPESTPKVTKNTQAEFEQLSDDEEFALEVLKRHETLICNIPFYRSFIEGITAKAMLELSLDEEKLKELFKGKLK